MKTLSATERFLFGRTRASMRGVAAVPGGIALLFLGHAIEDAGLLGAAPYIVIALVSASYILRPTVVAWVVLFAVFASYGVIVAGLHDNGSPGEWVLFMLLGLVPAALMWVARPRGSSWPEEPTEEPLIERPNNGLKPTKPAMALRGAGFAA